MSAELMALADDFVRPALSEQHRCIEVDTTGDITQEVEVNPCRTATCLEPCFVAPMHVVSVDMTTKTLISRDNGDEPFHVWTGMLG